MYRCEDINSNGYEYINSKTIHPRALLYQWKQMKFIFYGTENKQTWLGIGKENIFNIYTSKDLCVIIIYNTRFPLIQLYTLM